MKQKPGALDHPPTRRSVVAARVRVAAASAGVVAATAVSIAAIAAWGRNAALALLAVAVLWLSALWRRNSSLRQRYSGLQMLYGFTQLVGASLKAEAVTEEVLAEARKLLSADIAEIALLDEKTGACAYRLRSQEGPAGAGGDVPPRGLEDEPAWTTVVERRSPVLLRRGSKDPYLARVGVTDCILAPLVAENRVVGTIMVANRSGNLGTFDKDDLHIFATLANHASVAFENGRLVERLRREAEERRYEALHDPLTGLPNRMLFIQRVEEVTAGGEAAGVMLMDLDRFKEINDTLGHHNGDFLLREVAGRLLTALRRRDTVARLGGDEFAILLPSVLSADEVLEAAQRVVRVLQQPFRLEGLSVDVGASIGVAMYPDHGDDAATLLRRADVAMYEAKGGDRDVALYSPERDHNSPARLALAAELRSALANNQIGVHYQPKSRLSDGLVVGAEALVRWRHPERGLIGPDQFVPMAEQTGYITPLTLYILQESLEQCRTWSEAGYEVGVSVNLSLRSLLDTDLPRLVKTLLGSSGVPAQRLTLEITESSVMADPPRTIAVLERLAAIGVKLSVDDFGTGYSSLSYLRRLPVHEVKIDQSFVFRVASDPHDAAIVKSIIELGHSLGLRIVAEGVEDQLSWDTLRKMRCDEAQGFYLSRPVPGADLTEWLGVFRPEVTGELPAGGGVRSVLVVDDDRGLRKLICHLLDDAHSYTVHEAADGWEAIVQARRHQPDLILLDLVMPRMSGADALPNIRAVAPNARIVILSASDDKEMVAAAAKEGAVAFIDKADSLALLPDRVEVVLAS